VKQGLSGIWLIFGGLLVALLLGYLLLTAQKSYSWDETYEEDLEQPYGSEIFYNLLQNANGESFTDVTERIDSVLAAERENASYVVIGQRLYYDSLEVQELLRFVERGNTALLISEDFSAPLFDQLFKKSTTYSFGDQLDFLQHTVLRTHTDTTVQLLLYDPDTILEPFPSCSYIYDHEVEFKEWVYFDDIAQPKNEENGIYYLGSMQEEMVNFIAIAHGDGYFYLHSTPQVFSNFHLLRKENFEYVQLVMNQLPSSKIYWDGYNREFDPFNDFTNSGGHSDKFEQGPLAFVLSNKALRTSWYILLFLGLSYLAFGLRRKQSPVAMVQAPANTSIEYAKTIGTMFRHANNHKVMVEMKMKHWRHFVMEKYNIRFPEQGKATPELTKQLASRSGVSEDALNAIENVFFTCAYNPDLPAAELVKFHKALDKFYKNCK
jgi:hypothetical protein